MATPKVPSPVPSVNTALVDPHHLLTKTLRPREGKEFAQARRTEKN